ncbi:MAG: hypothetical protein AAF214_06065 [Pseudomonadota bacterium]
MRKIVRLYGHLPPITVALRDIQELDEDWWFNTQITPTPRKIAEHIKLISDADRQYPIVLDAHARLMDGMHRVVQALLAGEDTIQAIKLPITPAPDFRNADPDTLPYD